jgi:agmatinase
LRKKRKGNKTVRGRTIARRTPARRGGERFDPDAAARPGSGLFGLGLSPAESAAVVVPVPFEATVSYGGGTSRGPAAILRASGHVDLFDRETGRPYEQGIAMLPVPRRIEQLSREGKRLAAPVIRKGGAAGPGDRKLCSAARRVDAISERINEWVGDRTEALLAEGRLPVIVGGDHSVPFGAIQAAARAHPGMGILHIDAHADLRKAYEGFTWSHASIMYNVARRIPGVSRIVQVGLRDMGLREDRMIRHSKGRLVAFHDADIASRLARGEPFARIVQEIVAALPERVYISFDIDGLDPSLCPHTGTPVPGGLSFHQATGLLAALPRAGRTIVGCDLSEVAPGPRGDEWDANVGARILYKMIGFALKSRESDGPT